MSRKETDQISLGSVISLRSVSDAGLDTDRNLDNRSYNASRKSKKKGSPYGTPSKSLPKKSVKKTGREGWVEAVQNGGGMSAECSGMNTWKNGKPANLKNRSNTSHFLTNQLLMATCQPTRPSRPASATSARVGGSGPMYKDVESYYDEIQVLKRTMKQLKNENDFIKAKNVRLEDETISKSRKIDELLNPELQSNDMRRTLTSKKLNASEVVMSLRRKIHKLEENLRLKENETRKMASEMKFSDIDELRLENEMYLYEIQRLHFMLQESKFNVGQNTVPETIINDVLKDNQGNKAKLLIQKLTDDNHGLVLENKSLKIDLIKLTQGSSANMNLNKDYEDMNRSELLQKISSLEQKLKEEETVGRNNVKESTEVEIDSELIDDRCIELKGPLSQQLKQLRTRERELLTDVEKLGNNIKKLKEDRSHYRKMTDDYRQQLDNIKKDTRDGGSDTASIKSERSLSKTSVVSPRKKSITRTSPEQSKSKEDIQAKRIEKFKEKNAAVKIQRGWRQRQEGVKNDSKYKDDEDDYEEAIISIQSAWRGHCSRKQYLDDLRQKESEAELGDDDVLLIQSAFRGHSARKIMLSKANERNRRLSKNQESKADVRSYEIDDESDEDDDVVIGSSTSFTKYRNNKRDRDPMIYRDPDARSYAMRDMYNRDEERTERRRGNMSSFLEEEGNEGERFRADNKKMSIKQLQSSSSPWSKSIETAVDSDDDVVVSKTHKFKNNSRKSFEREKENDELTNKWANSGSIRRIKKEAPHQKQSSINRRNHVINEDDDDDDDLVIAPSFQKRLGSSINKKSYMNDELF